MNKKKKKYNLDELRDIYEDFRAQAELDYHDHGIVKEKDIMTIYNDFIEESLKLSQKYVRIIVGKGKVINPKVNRLLSKDKRVYTFNYSGHFSGGKGAFDVTLK